MRTANLTRSVHALAFALVAGSLIASCSEKDDPKGDPDKGSGGTGAVTFQDGAPDGNDPDADAGPPAQPPCPSLEQLSECGTVGVRATIRTANILLVIDKSGSMEDAPAGFNLSKWDALKSALPTALTDVADEINFGLLFYPFSTAKTIPLDCSIDECCLVPEGDDAIRVSIESGLASVPKITDELEKTAPGGGTPTAAALEQAYAYFTTGAGMNVEGDKYVLLATDGGPNCNFDLTCAADRCTTNLDGKCGSQPASCCDQLGALCLDDQSVLTQVKALKDSGISTFVVGIPGTEAYANYLDPIAEAGGKPAPAGSARKFYEVSASGGVQGLVNVFKTITTQLVRSCEIVLEQNPPEPTKVNVAVECEIIPKDQQDGPAWEIDTTTNPNKLVFKGKTCSWIQQNGAERIDVVYGCNPIR